MTIPHNILSGSHILLPGSDQGDLGGAEYPEYENSADGCIAVADGCLRRINR